MDPLAASIQIVDGIDPEDALNLMTPRNPPGVVRVRGQVDSLQPAWSRKSAKSDKPDWYFGTLSSLTGAARIDFKCAGYSPPDVGQLVILEGVLTYEGRGNHSGLKILLSGNYVGAFSIPETVATPLRPQDRAPRKSLTQYLETNDGGLENILVIGSDAGIVDLKNALGDHASRVRFERVPLTHFSRVIEIIRTVPCEAVVLVRGSDDAPLNFWNSGDCVRQLLNSEKYFYTALSYAQRPTLADLFADQPFLTPSHCGQAIVAVLNELQIKRELCLALDSKTTEIVELQEARENDQMWSERKVASQMYEFSQIKRRLDNELAMVLREKRLANLWVKLFAAFSAVLFAALFAFIFDVGGIRELILQRI